MSELKIKLGVDLSEVDSAASQIPDKIERAARKQRRPAMKPLRVWDELAGKWVPASNQQNPQIPGGPSNRGAPTPMGYGMPIGPGLPGMPGGRPLPQTQVSERQYNTPIGPGLPGMPGGVLRTDLGVQRDQQNWADNFRDNMMKALEKSALRMVVPVHLINRFTSFIVNSVVQAFDNAREALKASRATGETITDAMKLGQYAERFGLERGEMYGILEEAKQRLGKGTFRGGEAVVALQRLGFGIQQVRNGSINSVDVLKRLADEYNKSGASAQLAAIGVDIFGSNFQKLIPLLQNGSEGIQEAMENMATMSEGSVRVFDEISYMWTRFVELVKSLTFDLILLIPRAIMELENSLRVRRNMGMFEQGETVEGAKEALAELSKVGTSGNTGLRMRGESIESFLNRFERDYVTEETRGDDLNEDERKAMKEAIDDMRKGLKLGIGNTGSLPMATSLQAMGGGDILSALQRNPMEEVARNTAETASNTAIMAKKNVDNVNINQTEIIITK